MWKKRKKPNENETQLVSQSFSLFCVSRCFTWRRAKSLNEKETSAVEPKLLSLLCNSIVQSFHSTVNRIATLPKHNCITRVFCNKPCYKLGRLEGMNHARYS